LRKRRVPVAPELIRREILLPASPGEVWEALTDGRQVSEWFGAEVEMVPRLGGRVRFRWRDGGERSAVIEAFEAERLLVLRWLPFQRDADGKTRRRPSTKVRFTLRPGEGGTQLAVQETFPIPPQEQSLPSDAVDLEELRPTGLHLRAGAGQ
jgi:uncharacterized protein YndB with AHSA1/START domain